jgi:tetratricopeptide (TPR) repeat protein
MELTGGIAGGAKTIVPLAVKELKKLRRRDEVRNLFNDATKHVRSDHRVPAEHKKEVLARVKGLRVDPTVGGCLKRLLDGDNSVLPNLEARAAQLLQFGSAVDNRAVVRAFMEAVEAHVVFARRDDRRALATVYRAQEAGFGRFEHKLEEIVRSGQAAAEESRERDEAILGAVSALPARSPSSAFAFITSGRSLSSETPQLLGKLGEVNSALASEVAGRLAEGGGEALSAWASEHTGRLSSAGARANELLGRILMSEGAFGSAYQRFLTAADADVEDPGRQLVRASHAAKAVGDADLARDLRKRAADIGGPEHPAVLIAETQSGNVPPDEVLATLSRVRPRTEIDRLAVHTGRAQAHLLKNDLDQAAQALEAAEKSHPADQSVRELRCLWRLISQQEVVAGGGQVDLAQVQSAKDGFMALRDELLSIGRTDESGHMLRRAVEAALLAHQPDTAAELLDSATSEETSGEARLMLARLAAVSGLQELALELSSADDSEDARLVAATVGVESPDPREREAALHVLDELLFSDDEQIRREAALSRALACIHEPDPPTWSDRAHEILRAANAVQAEVIRARAHLARREFDAAEALLRPVADDRRALAALVDAAAMRNDIDLALERVRALLRFNDGPDTHLLYARLLLRHGAVAEALKEYESVARGPGPLLPAERRQAFRGALQTAQNLGRFAQMAELAEKAVANAPQDEELHWALAYARHRLGRHRAALDDLDRHQITPRDVDAAELLSRIVYRAVRGPDLLRRLAALSDQFGRPEALEFMIIAASPQVPDADETTSHRVRETFSTFHQRFPDSKFLVQMEAPKTDEEIRDWLQEMAPPTGRGYEADDGVRRGEMVTAFLAAAHGQALSQIWPALDLLPTAYGDATLDELELQDARDALTHAAVLDPSSLAVITTLGMEVEQAVRTALPGSVISQSTLDDADRAGDPATDPRQPTATLTRDRSGEPLIRETDPIDAERRAARQDSHVRLAQTLAVEPDADPDSDNELDRVLRRAAGVDVDPALRTWISTLALARRLQLPILSDDRRVRIYARAEGRPAFGTLAVLRALSELGDVPNDLHAKARLTLLQHGAVGLKPSADELAEVAERADWQMTLPLFRVLTDQTWWQAVPLETWSILTGLLVHVWHQAPDQLAAWMEHLLNAGTQVVPHLNARSHTLLLFASAWGWTPAETGTNEQFFRALIGVLRPQSRLYHLHDVPLEALVRYGAVNARLAYPRRMTLLLKAVSWLPITDQITAVDLLGSFGLFRAT